MDKGALEALLNSYAFWLAISFAVGAFLTFIIMFKIDKYFTAALLCLEVMVLIAASTWGKSFVFEGFISLSSEVLTPTKGVAKLSLGGVTTDELIFGIIGIGVAGLLAFLFMLLRYGLDRAGIVPSQQGNPR
jgi:hypothetical protein